MRIGCCHLIIYGFRRHWNAQWQFVQIEFFLLRCGVLQILHTPYTALHTLAQYFLVSSCISNFWFWGEGGSGRRFTHLGSFFLLLQHTLYCILHAAHCTWRGCNCTLRCDSKPLYWSGSKKNWALLEYFQRCFSIYSFKCTLHSV